MRRGVSGVLVRWWVVATKGAEPLPTVQPRPRQQKHKTYCQFTFADLLKYAGLPELRNSLRRACRQRTAIRQCTGRTA